MNEFLDFLGLNHFFENIVKKWVRQETALDAQKVINALGYTPATENTIPVFNLDVVDGDLIMYYADNSSAPLAHINSNGELIMNL